MEKLKNAIEKILAIENKSLQNLFSAFIEEAVFITDSEIGYFAIVNSTEDTLLMIGWSQTSMENCSIMYHPIVYSIADTGLWGDAVRERKPVVTNDYKNCDKPTKKGFPDGHIQVSRHFNVPIFEGDHITAVVGVGNKKNDYSAEDVNCLSQYSQSLWPELKKAIPEIMLK
jgi:hypothetical protein